MRIFTSYSVRIRHYNAILEPTLAHYRDAVDFYIDVIDREWQSFSDLEHPNDAKGIAEAFTIPTKGHPAVKYDFTKRQYKFPSYYRRAAIAKAFGLVSSWRSQLKRWELSDPESRGKRPGRPCAGNSFPALYRKGSFLMTGTYTARIKTWIRNTWDWLDVELKKGDVDYILRRCAGRKELCPSLVKHGKRWALAFSFEERAKLCDTDIPEQIVLAVDLGINSAATCSAMLSDGTVLGREFLSLPGEEDSLKHAVGKICRAQKHGARRMPRLWAKARGLSSRIAVLTAQFIVDMAIKYNADVIVFEHLDASGKKCGSKKQRLHMWRCQYVQAMVADKAHRLHMHVSHVCAWNTSRLAYDGSGRASRGKEAGFTSYSICRFPSGKIYNCDLGASYNIGARYFIREIVKSLPETAWLAARAKVPELARRSTCTLSSLIRLNAALAA